MPLEIKENISLAPYTTFKVGGPSRYFATVTLPDELTEALQWVKKNKQPVFILGGGSNTLVSDQGWSGLTLELQLRGVRAEKKSDHIELTIAAGESWDGVVRRAVQEGWSGIECLSGIPGSAGGAVVQNIGAYGQTLAEVVTSVHCVEIATNKPCKFSHEECDFAYRDSRFKSHDEGKYIVTAFTIRLRPGGAATPSYRDHRFSLGKVFENRSEPPTLAEVREAVLNIREQKGMVMLPGRFSLQSAGSVFKNLVVSDTEFKRIEEAAGSDPVKKKKLMPWFWEQPSATSAVPQKDVHAQKQFKISAAFLLEYTAFSRGFVRGSVGVSPRHPLSIITLNQQANAREIVVLARDMQEAVRDKFGIVLEPEIKLIGFAEYPLLK